MYEFLEYQVGDVMTYRPVTIGRQTPLGEVARLFEEHDFNCLPVTEEGWLLGVLTKTDLLKAFAFTPFTMVPPYDAIMRQTAERVMTRNPVVVAPDTPLTAVLQMMSETGHRSFPVAIGALLIGLVARQDVVRALCLAAAGEHPSPAERKSRPLPRARPPAGSVAAP